MHIPVPTRSHKTTQQREMDDMKTVNTMQVQGVPNAESVNVCSFGQEEIDIHHENGCDSSYVFFIVFFIDRPKELT